MRAAGCWAGRGRRWRHRNSSSRVFFPGVLGLLRGGRGHLGQIDPQAGEPLLEWEEYGFSSHPDLTCRGNLVAAT